MVRASANSILQSAAKTLAWELYATAAYCRTRRYVDVEKFNRELLSAARQWAAAHANLKGKRRRNGKTEQQ
jgi:hypothetical protein